MWRIALLAICGLGVGPAFADGPARPDADAAECGVTAAQYERPTVAYLCDALVAVQRYSLTVGTVDWPAIKANALAQVEAAQSLFDVHPIIRAMLKALGDNHSILLPAERVAQLRAPTAQIDHAAMAAGARVAYIDLRGFFGTHRESMHAYVRALWSDLAASEAEGACAYVIDLRRNRGGNMWPSLLGLQPLLGVGKIGAFRSRDDSTTVWRLEPDRATLDEVPVITVADPPEHLDAAATRPVAVLFGPETASSAEAIAIAFRQRPLTRSFGWHTYGATTANIGFLMKDGAVVNLAVSDLVDRAGVRYAPYVTPDEETTHERLVRRSGATKDVTRAAALYWLGQTPGCSQ